MTGGDKTKKHGNRELMRGERGSEVCNASEDVFIEGARLEHAVK